MRVGSGARAVWEELHDRVRSRLWPLPVAAVVLALIAGLTLPHLDAAMGASLPGSMSSAFFGGDAEAARSVLGAVASSLITVTSLTFSLTVVTLQLASSQFSPRLLRTFASDVFVQTTLGVFLGTFIYSLTVLRSVRSSLDDGTEFVPRLSVTVAFLLTVVSVVLLIVFLAHLSQLIRVERMLRTVRDDATETIRNTLPPVGDGDGGTPIEGDGRAGPPTIPAGAVLPDVPETAVPLLAPTSGYLLRVDQKELLEACVDLDAVCVLDKVTGSSLVEGCPIGWIWALDGQRPAAVTTELRERLASSIHTGFERTSVQDIGHGLRQLTDVANKALSPGINDPTTAMHALGDISALLCEITTRELRPEVLRDDEGRIRVVLHRPDLADLVEVSIAQPRRYGASDPQVMQRLYELLAELAWHCRPGQFDIVRRQLERLNATVQDQDFDTVELARFERAAETVRWSLTYPHP